ncbi:MAG: MFS transporter [Burkholderiales bacterium]|nr:MFS transporter [Burkholderiales bacterium]
MRARQLIAYGLFGLPLAMAALPLYVHLPKFYGGELGMSLALVGAILLAARLLDALQDPLLGYLSDRARGRKRFVLAALPLLAAGMLGLFNPPAIAGTALALWLLVCLVVVYLGFSMGSISYQAWGAQISSDRNERTRITASRETFTLIGVVAAAALPAMLGSGEAEQLSRFALLFVLLLAACAAITLWMSPEVPAPPRPAGRMFAALAQPLGNGTFRKLLLVFVLNGIASAIPATLVLFFMSDVLQLGERAGLFLALYFVSGAAGMPLWVALARRYGKRNAWLAAMLLSIAAFAWAYGLGAGDAQAYAMVCILSGMALGADLALPPSLLADVMDEDANAAAARSEGAYFGIWNLVTKLNLALAAGIALPLLDALGYAPGTAGGGAALSFVYCLVPCALKLAAAAALWLLPLGAPFAPSFTHTWNPK